jgi:predicted HicB family RNase H-like nuclease
MAESRILIRIPSDLHERLRVLAALESQSVNGLIVDLLEEGSPPEKIKRLVENRYPGDV